MAERPVFSEMFPWGRENLGVTQKQREQDTETQRFHVKTKD